MVDIHSHVLYGLDDGAPNLEISIAMLRMAASDGTTDIVATPHSDLKYQFNPAEIARQLAYLSQIPGIPRLHQGCDFHLSFDNLESLFRSHSKYTINGLKYLLVEFANDSIPGGISDVLRKMLDLGLCPVITHPERNPLLAKRIRQIEKWVQMGCKVQVTGQSFTGRFGKTANRVAHALTSKGLTHFVASDGHDLDHRPPLLGEPFQVVKAEYGEAIAQSLFVTNPTAVLTGESLPPHQERVTKTSRWFKLW